MTDLSTLQARRLAGWRQTPDTRVPDPDAAEAFLNQAGLVTLFLASSEVPNLYHAHMGDPNAATQSAHNSPSGYVYSWRWTLGHRAAGFYTALVRKKPTWVSWDLLPAVLRLCGETRSPEELHAAGRLSRDALRVSRALAEAGDPLATGDLRREAGFPTGKENRAAYLKAVEELESRLLLAKLFSPDEGDGDMFHALVSLRYPEHAGAAAQLSPEEAMDQLLARYLPLAAYAVPSLLAKHCGLPEGLLGQALTRMAEKGLVAETQLPGLKGPCYVVT